MGYDWIWLHIACPFPKKQRPHPFALKNSNVISLYCSDRSYSFEIPLSGGRYPSFTTIGKTCKTRDLSF